MMIAVLVACSKEPKLPDNPYQQSTGNQNGSGTNDSIVDPNSIQALYRDIFYPTCANSGCHDGTFEPDFRTIESSYQSLVNVPPIKNDSVGTFASRVVPGNADGSILIYRLTINLGGNSGIMPLALEPNSDWPSKKNDHIQKIKNWINNGAKDTKGKSPLSPNYPIQLMGAQLMAGSIQMPRGGKYEPIVASPGNYQLYISLNDDVLTQNNITNVKINLSTDPNDFKAVNEINVNLLGTPSLLDGLFSSNTSYYWMVNLDLSGYSSGTVVWLRVSADDGSNGTVLLPSPESMFRLKKYLAIKIQ